MTDFSWSGADAARRRFGFRSVQGRGRLNSRYVAPPIYSSGKFLPLDEVVAESSEAPFYDLLFLFRGGVDVAVIWSDNVGGYLGPNFAMLVGSYGVGKTEQVHVICDRLLAQRASKPEKPRPDPVPIALGSCIERFRNLSNNATTKQFAALLLGDNNSIERVSDFLEAFRNGKVLLYSRCS